MGRALVAALAVSATFAVLPAAASDARQAVQAFLAQAGSARVTDLVVRQTITLYDPSGRHAHSTGEQELFIKVPGRQRLEQTLDGRREVRLTVAGRTWVRDPEGKTAEAPSAPESDRSHLLASFRRTADDVMAEWRALGVRTDVAYPGRYHGRTVTIIGAAPDDRDVPAVWLDGERGVVRLVTRERLPQGEALVDRAFSEHRPLVPGVLYPYRQELFADGKLLVLVVVRSVAVNTGLSDSLFDPDALRRAR